MVIEWKQISAAELLELQNYFFVERVLILGVHVESGLGKRHRLVADSRFPIGGGTNLLFGQICLKSSWKWRKLGQEADASNILLSRSAVAAGADPGFPVGGGAGAPT